jgi:hypothetical protein
MYAAQCGERARAAIHDVAGEPDAVAIGLKADAFEERCKLRVTSLYVPDGVNRHEKSG